VASAGRRKLEICLQANLSHSLKSQLAGLSTATLAIAHAGRSGYQGYALGAMIAAPATNPQDNSQYEIRCALARIAP
jgi:hypothetical protein